MFQNFLFNRKLVKAEMAFCRLRIAVERLELPKLERRKIFKDLLRSAGFAGIRIREKREG